MEETLEILQENLAQALLDTAYMVVISAIIGVVLLRIIFVGLTFMSVSSNLQYIIKGLIILVACAIDMRKYLVRK